jgi:hypothetical protein
VRASSASPSPPEEIIMPFTRTLTCAAALSAALWIAEAPAADAPAARPGDEALTCDQIYAEATAQSQRDQAEREKRNAERRRQSQATMALGTAAMLTGGVGGTAQAAQKAAEAQAASTMADAAAPPPPNPRMEYLKQLWTQKHCVMKK